MSIRPSLAVIEKIADQGISAIESGNFTLVNGPDGSKALLDRLNARAAKRMEGSSPTHG